MKLYDFPSSPHCLKVRAVAYELGVRLELTTVNVFRRETEAPLFRALNPNGLVPVLVDGDFVLWESNAIITYLATTHPTPSLLPTDARGRADVDRWLHWQSAHLAPLLSRMAFELFVRPVTGQRATDRSIVTSARQDFYQRLESGRPQLDILDCPPAKQVTSAERVGDPAEYFGH